jgi:hypothetical protein
LISLAKTTSNQSLSGISVHEAETKALERTQKRLLQQTLSDRRRSRDVARSRSSLHRLRNSIRGAS